MQTETEFFSALGIYYSNDYQETLEKNWSEATNKIMRHTSMLFNRKLTLHQRVTYANTCLLSKLWYISHVYPLKENHAQNVNKVLFLYIWGGRYEPVKRSVLYRAKDQGGLAVINCLLKSRTLMLNTFIKCYTHDAYINSLMFHYCHSRLSNVLPTDYSILILPI